MQHHKETEVVTKELVNLGFLPAAIQNRIAETFDFYFGLGGFRARTQTVNAEEAPNFPNQLSGLESGEVGDLLANATSWFAFTNEKLRYIGVALQVLNAELDQSYDSALVGLSGGSTRGGLTESERKSKAKLDPVYLGMLMYRNKLENVKGMLDNLSKTYDRNITTLSREVTRRERTTGLL